jgi:WD40 repeat protein
MIRKLLWIVLLLGSVAFAQEVTSPVLSQTGTLPTSYVATYQLSFNSDGTQLAVLSAATDEANLGKTALQWFVSGETVEVTVEGQTLYQAAFHPILPILVTTSLYGDISVWDTGTRTVLTTVKGHESSPEIVFAPNGQSYVTVDWSGLIIWSGLSNEPQFFLPSDNTADDAATRIAISPDSQYVAWVDMPSTIVVAALATGEVVARVATNYEVEPYRIGFTPTNQLALAYGTLELWDIGTGQQAGRVITEEAVRDFAYTPDGTRLVLLETDNIVRVMDMATETVLAIANETGVPVWEITLSPDGKRLALGIDNGAVVYEMP